MSDTPYQSFWGPTVSSDTASQHPAPQHSTPASQHFASSGHHYSPANAPVPYVSSAGRRPPRRWGWVVVLLIVAVAAAAFGIAARDSGNVSQTAQSATASVTTVSETALAAIQTDAEKANTGQADTASSTDGLGTGTAAEVQADAASGSQSSNLVLVQQSSDASSSDEDSSTATSHEISVNSAVVKLLPSAVAIYSNRMSVVGREVYNSTGSGVIIDDSGLVLTAAHVLLDSNNRPHMTSGILVEFDNGYVAQANLLGYDTATDIALIKFNPAGYEFEAAELADISTLKVGDHVIAIGAPFNFINSVNVGYVSGLNRVEILDSDHDGPPGVPTIQTDAPINPGNSGGMLATTGGKVVGINVFIRTVSSLAAGTGGNVGLGFAVPIDTALRIVNLILDTDYLRFGSLGITGQKFQGLGPGPEVVSVVPGSPAQAAGLRVGDRITHFDGKQVRSMHELASFVHYFPPGEDAEIVLLRDGESVTVTATIALNPRATSTHIIS